MRCESLMWSCLWYFSYEDSEEGEEGEGGGVGAGSWIREASGEDPVNFLDPGLASRITCELSTPSLRSPPL